MHIVLGKNKQVGRFMRRETIINQGMRVVVCFMIGILLVYVIYKKTRFYYNRPIFIPFSVRLNAYDLVLPVGDSYHLRVMNINKRVSFSSTDFKVADVRFNGKIVAYRTGTAIINVSVDDTIVKCKVTVIDLSQSSITIGVGKNTTLSVDGWNGSVLWSSKNTDVVTIEEDGVLTGRCKGKTVVIAEVNGKTLRCTVTVK